MPIFFASGRPRTIPIRLRSEGVLTNSYPESSEGTPTSPLQQVSKFLFFHTGGINDGKAPRLAAFESTGLSLWDRTMRDFPGARSPEKSEKTGRCLQCRTCLRSWLRQPLAAGLRCHPHVLSKLGLADEGASIRKPLLEFDGCRWPPGAGAARRRQHLPATLGNREQGIADALCPRCPTAAESQ